MGMPFEIRDVHLVYFRMGQTTASGSARIWVQIAPEVGRAAKVAPALYSTYCIGGAPKSIKPTQWAHGSSCQLSSPPLLGGGGIPPH